MIIAKQSVFLMRDRYPFWPAINHCMPWLINPIQLAGHFKKEYAVPAEATLAYVNALVYLVFSNQSPIVCSAAS